MYPNSTIINARIFMIQLYIYNVLTIKLNLHMILFLHIKRLGPAFSESIHTDKCHRSALVNPGKSWLKIPSLGGNNMYPAVTTCTRPGKRLQFANLKMAI